MTLSDNGINLIKNFEGCVLHVYLDQKNIKTAGIGHTGGLENMPIGTPITQEQADQWLKEDTTLANNFVSQKTDQLGLNQNQHDSLVSLTFNIGTGNFANSTLLKDLLSGNIQAAADQFLVWSHTNGTVNQGLLNRRTAERTLFLTPINPPNA